MNERMNAFALALPKMSNETLVALWNVTQIQLRGGLPMRERETLIATELSSRNIPHESGKRIIKKENA